MTPMGSTAKGRSGQHAYKCYHRYAAFHSRFSFNHTQVAFKVNFFPTQCLTFLHGCTRLLRRETCPPKCRRWFLQAATLRRRKESTLALPAQEQARLLLHSL
ncbi:hypothetical protein DUNSADRAFT_3919 [Dunaliella salina]|uniref:Encoded protein n=1 Tax=Dunaliella salina TaxID=3046 RepID=A0ABQ7FVL4_DUNSA|nr:hypothetical protein DUNSADRAFT_3919 [Dunaliella salina]|eukprot:KAF5826256.1 hypothetical protein DUNSADRAFT_3919 [Dunaliella salina]